MSLRSHRSFCFSFCFSTPRIPYKRQNFLYCKARWPLNSETNNYRKIFLSTVTSNVFETNISDQLFASRTRRTAEWPSIWIPTTSFHRCSIDSRISERTISVRIDGVLSQPFLVNGGVPQGFVRATIFPYLLTTLFPVYLIQFAPLTMVPPSLFAFLPCKHHQSRPQCWKCIAEPWSWKHLLWFSQSCWFQWYESHSSLPSS